MLATAVRFQGLFLISITIQTIPPESLRPRRRLFYNNLPIIRLTPRLKEIIPSFVPSLFPHWTICPKLQSPARSLVRRELS